MSIQSGMPACVEPGRSVFAAGHLGELTQLVPPDLVDEVLCATGRVERRVRKLPSRVVVYFVLAMALFPREAYRGGPAPGVRADRPGSGPWPGTRTRALRAGLPSSGSAVVVFDPVGDEAGRSGAGAVAGAAQGEGEGGAASGGCPGCEFPEGVWLLPEPGAAGGSMLHGRCSSLAGGAPW